MRQQDELYQKIEVMISEDNIETFKELMTKYSMVLMREAFKSGWKRCVEEFKKTGSLWEPIDKGKAG